MEVTDPPTHACLACLQAERLQPRLQPSSLGSSTTVAGASDPRAAIPSWRAFFLSASVIHRNHRNHLNTTTAARQWGKKGKGLEA